jgi:hypothetical protein
MTFGHVASYPIFLCKCNIDFNFNGIDFFVKCPVPLLSNGLAENQHLMENLLLSLNIFYFIFK